jgi:hypothetical protein
MSLLGIRFRPAGTVWAVPAKAKVDQIAGLTGGYYESFICEGRVS